MGSMTRTYKRFWGAIVVVAGGAVITWSVLTVVRESDEGGGESPRVESSERDASSGVEASYGVGHVAVTLDEASQRRIGLVVRRGKAARRSPVVRAYGRLEADPAFTFVLRAGIAGIVQPVPRQPWPELGERLEAGTVVGSIRPRLSAAERYDLSARLMQARAEIDEAKADLAADRSSYENKKRLNESGKVVSDRALEEAEARVKRDGARLSAATQTAELLENAVRKGPAGNESFPLEVGKSGEVVTLLAQPGEAVTSGQTLLRSVDFSRLTARVAVPAGSHVAGSVSSVRLVVIGHEEWVVGASAWSRAGRVDSTTGGDAYLIRVESGDRLLRPGMAVTAYLEGGGAAVAGIRLPRSAVVRLAGQAWVYVQAAPDRFIRTGVHSFVPIDDATWFVGGGVSPGDSVVTTGAQELLSEELKAQIEAEDEDED